MSRSDVLLKCRNSGLAPAGGEAWEGRRPGNDRRLLADRRREKRFVRFLELSGVGMADGTDEESAYAGRLDMWIAWEAEEEAVNRIPHGGTANLSAPLSTCSVLFFGGFL
jgi:hypothetical protein